MATGPEHVSDDHDSLATHDYDPASGHDVPHHGHALDEPSSPIWLPIVGVGLFALLLLWWLSTPNDAQERAAAAAASASASAANSAAVVVPPTSASQGHAAPRPTPPSLPSGFIRAPH